MRDNKNIVRKTQLKVKINLALVLHLKNFMPFQPTSIQHPIFYISLYQKKTVYLHLKDNYSKFKKGRFFSQIMKKLFDQIPQKRKRKREINKAKLLSIFMQCIIFLTNHKLLICYKLTMELFKKILSNGFFLLCSY